jgi:hypothetical protein
MVYSKKREAGTYLVGIGIKATRSTILWFRGRAPTNQRNVGLKLGAANAGR